MSTVIVIGGGIAGLACAHRLLEFKEENRRLDLDVILTEKETRLGGIIGTDKKSGFLLEKGPDAFISEKTGGLMLCKQLGIDGDLIGTNEANRKSFVIRKGKLCAVPEGFYLTAPVKLGSFLASPLLSLPGRIRTVIEIFIPRSKNTQDESVGNFIRRRFGKEMLDRVGQAMLAGIYAGDPEVLSLRAVMARFADLEARYGSVIRGLQKEARGKDRSLWQVRGPRYSLFLSFRGGMQTLTDAVARRIPAGAVRLGFEARKISYHPLKKEWTVVSETGESLTGAAVCLSVPPKAAARLVADADTDLSAKLSRFESESLATVYFAFEKKAFPRPIDGFGFVVPAAEGRALIACSFTSNKFSGRAPEGYALLRVFLGGVFGRKFYAMDDAELVETARRELTEILGISGLPYFSHLIRHPASMIQYRVGHMDRIAEIRAACERQTGLYVTGAAYRGVGIPDCIEDGRTQAETIFRKVCS